MNNKTKTKGFLLLLSENPYSVTEYLSINCLFSLHSATPLTLFPVWDPRTVSSLGVWMRTPFSGNKTSKPGSKSDWLWEVAWGALEEDTSPRVWWLGGILKTRCFFRHLPVVYGLWDRKTEQEYESSFLPTKNSPFTQMKLRSLHSRPRKEAKVSIPGGKIGD